MCVTLIQAYIEKNLNVSELLLLLLFHLTELSYSRLSTMTLYQQCSGQSPQVLFIMRHQATNQFPTNLGKSFNTLLTYNHYVQADYLLVIESLLSNRPGQL